jgi:hypothetical protein
MDNDNDNERDDAPDDHPRAHTWNERHGATIMGAVLAVLLGIVIFNQVAC